MVLNMRIDKYLKVSRLIKRRTLAQRACTAGMIMLNGKKAKPGADVKVDDIIDISIRGYSRRVKVLLIMETVTKPEASALYEIIDNDQDDE